MEIQLNTEVWKEYNMYVAYVPQLDLSSCGKTLEEAKKNIREALEAFLEETKRMGTLQQILEEAGFTFEKEWKAPEIISLEKMRLAL
jgi:predicted RNase H-like HicB family nuclease